MNATAEPARATPAPDERSPTEAATDSPTGERPAAGAPAPRKGVPRLGPLVVQLADRDALPGGGRPVVIGVFVGAELDPAAGRSLGGQFQYGGWVGGELQDAATAGKELVRGEVAAAVAVAPSVAAAEARGDRLRGSLTKYATELQTAHRGRAEAREGVSRAIADGSDPGPFETREAAALDVIRQLETRLTGTRSALDATAADIARTTANVGRAVRARLLAQATARLDELSAIVADSLFSQLIEITRARAAIVAARGG